jgi:hypothetical protein
MSPLYDLKISGEEIKRIIREDWKICLPEPYKYLSHNNCIPCFKGGKSHWKQICLHYPEEFKKAKDCEVEIGNTVFKDYSLKELEKIWKSEKKNQFQFWDEDDNMPCLCAV